MTKGQKLWDSTFDQHDTHLQSLAFVGGGRLLRASGGGGWQLDWHWRVTLWDVATVPTEIASLPESPAVAPNGVWLALPLDAGAKLQQVSTQQEGGELTLGGDVGPSHFGTYNNMKFYPQACFSPDGTLVAISKLWRTAKEPPLSKWVPQKYNPCRGRESGPVVRVWDVPKGKELESLDGTTAAQFSPDGKILAGLRDGEIIDLWAVPFRKPLWPIVGWTTLSWLAIVLAGWLLRTGWRKLHGP
jgi:WD40 repeat protein